MSILQSTPVVSSKTGSETRAEECGNVWRDSRPMASQRDEPLTALVRQAIARTRDWLLSQQRGDGHWVGELEGDTILESETILLLAFLGRESSDLAHRLAQYLVETQLPEGGWAKYPGGKVDVSGSVKAYFALKLTGHDLSADTMQQARRAIRAHGGADAVNSYTRYFLAMLGQIPYSKCPAVPPEVVLLPRWLPVNLSAVSTWSRTIIVPLSIVSALEPVRQVGPAQGIRELFLREPEDWPPLRCPGLSRSTGLFSWDRFFRTVNRALKWCQRNRLVPFRSLAIREAERWMVARFANSDGLGAIYPPIVWSLVALRALGYSDDSREVVYCHKQLKELVLWDERSGAARLQPCKSPVWDTAIAMRALSAGGVRRSFGDDSGCGVALAATDYSSGRLERDSPCRAGRLVFRIQQRFLPRFGRHRHGVDGPPRAVRLGGPQRLESRL